MGLSVSGLGSGLDINSMVQQLVEAERVPKQERITNQLNSIETDISAYGRLKAALDELNSVMSTFRDEGTFAAHIATSSQSDVISVNASSEAINGVYDIAVDHLAQSHKILSNSIDKEQILGAGVMALSLGDQSMVINLSENSKLVDIVKAVNNDDLNPGITASLINDDNGSRLVFNSDATGADNQLTISVNADAASPLNQFAFDKANANTQMIEMQEPRNAAIVIDGLAVVSSSTNTVSNAIQGVELNIQATTSADKGLVSVLVEQDHTKVKESLTKFVDTYNAFFQITKSVTAFDPETGTGGPLMGDAVVRSSLSQLRNLFSSTIADAPANLNTLSEFGIITAMDGRLEINDKVLDTQIKQNFNILSAFFDGADGFVSKLENVINNFTGSSGSINNRETSLAEQKSRLQDEQSLLEQRMVELEERLYRQFSAMDTALGRMNSQLQTMLSILPSEN